MTGLNSFVDYNPIALGFNKLLNWSGLFSELSQYFGHVLFHRASTRVSNLFFIAGVLGLSWKILHGLHTQYTLWKWVPAHNRNRADVTSTYFKQKYGDCYAVVTGCTQGIGLGYALQLARLGLGVVLVARNKEKLERRIQEIKNIVPNFRYQKVIGDFGKEQDVKRITQQIVELSKKIDIGIIVNNAGYAGGQFQKFISFTQKNLMDILNINFGAIYQINSALVPVLRKRQKRSAILNLSSCTGIFLCHGNGTYSSSKKILDIYSRTMSIQNRDKIDVLSVRPFGVQTPMMSMKKGKFMITPKDCVISSLADLGKVDTTWTGFLHKIQASYFQKSGEVERLKIYDKIFEFVRK